MLKQLWKDESGAVLSTEVVLVITILGIGMIVGLTTLRNAVVSELADTAGAINDINQSYSYSGVIGHTSQTAGSQFTDLDDLCDVGQGQQGIGSQGVDVAAAQSPEGQR